MPDNASGEMLCHNSWKDQNKTEALVAEIASTKTELNKVLQEDKKSLLNVQPCRYCPGYQ